MNTMASSEQLALSDFIKSVHQELREKTRCVGVDDAWKSHCEDEVNLRKYACAMKALATKYWEQNQILDSNVVSRIEWTSNFCKNYFLHEIVRHRAKEKEIAAKIDCTIASTGSFMHTQLNLLDVGSCYHPFRKFDYFNVTAIDISPALREVLKCDFLTVKIGESLITDKDEVLELPNKYYDVVVFSLLLEYLPSPKQRLTCCERAYSLLKTEGLLVVITPDSNHVGANAKYIKSWRYVLADIGFSRIKYEKLHHIHCMVFRKSLSKEISQRWAMLHKKGQIYNEIFIPQDFKVIPDAKEPCIKGKENSRDEPSENFIEFLKEVPYCDVFQ